MGLKAMRMSSKFKILAGTALAVGLMAAASSSQATVFATVTGAKVHWQEELTGPYAGGGQLTGTSFSQLTFLPSGPGPLKGLLNFNAGVAATPATETTVGTTTTITQTGIAGSFDDIYWGKGAPIVVNGVTLTRSVSDMFDGSFIDGTITGKVVNGVSKGGMFTALVTGYSSPLVTTPPGGSFVFKLALHGNGLGWIIDGPNQPIHTFNAIGDGAFSGGGVPEPATWAMMLLGLGGIGATMRSKRRKLAASATA